MTETHMDMSDITLNASRKYKSTLWHWGINLKCIFCPPSWINPQKPMLYSNTYLTELLTGPKMAMLNLSEVNNLFLSFLMLVQTKIFFYHFIQYFPALSLNDGNFFLFSFFFFFQLNDYQLTIGESYSSFLLKTNFHTTFSSIQSKTKSNTQCHYLAYSEICSYSDPGQSLNK